MFGVNGNKDACDAIKAGEMYGTALQLSYMVGVYTVRAAYDLTHKGRQVPEQDPGADRAGHARERRRARRRSAGRAEPARRRAPDAACAPRRCRPAERAAGTVARAGAPRLGQGGRRSGSCARTHALILLVVLIIAGGTCSPTSS